jgi:hypothetical protein
MIHRWIGLAILLASAAGAQAPADVNLTLSSKDGRTQFRQGEAIELKLVFQASTTGKYAVWPRYTDRIARNSEYDKFSAEPVAGAFDPLADSGAIFAGRAHTGPPDVPTPVDAVGVPVYLFLNEWIVFRQPGHYNVTVETTRLVTQAAPNAGIALKSNGFELEVTPVDVAWDDMKVKEASAVLDIPDFIPRVGQRGPGFQQMEAARIATENAARTLRFLETPAAAHATVKYLGHGPQYARAQLHAAMMSTPCRKDIVAALEEAVAAPDIAIYQEYYFALQDFAVGAQLGPITPAWTPSTDMAKWVREVEMPYRERTQPFRDAVTARMITALAHKQGEALAISLATLGGTGTQAPAPALKKALIENFPMMPVETQSQWLTQNWPRIADPALGPALKLLASGSSDLRDQALIRLTELDPAAVRPLALDRIRRGDISRQIYHNDRALLALPDKTLPELDDALAANVERRIVHAEVLLARYASPAIEDRVKQILDGPGFCSGPLLAYLFRVDPDSAAKRMAQGTGTRRCDLGEIQGSEDLLMSPGLEKELIRELDPAITPSMRVGIIVSFLQSGGSAATKQPMLDAMLIPAQAPTSPLPPGVTLSDNRASNVLNAVGWLPSAADLEKALAICQSDQCRRSVTNARTQLAEPVGISPDALLSYARIGQVMLRSPQQVKDKLAQFPKGTSFYVAVGYPGTWWAEQRRREFEQMIVDAGMKLVAEPPRAPLPH